MAEPFNHQLVKLSKEGEELFRLNGFVVLGDAAIDPKDGSFWVADYFGRGIIKVSQDGRILKRVGGFNYSRFLDVYWEG